MPAHIHFAKGGEAAIMSELLCRGYNVAVPWVDSGDDMYVVEDAKSNFIRVQVKAARCVKRRTGIWGQVTVARRQLEESKKTKLVFAIALRYTRTWQRIMIIPREKLEREVSVHKLGSRSKNSRNQPTVSFMFHYTEEGRVSCYQRDFTQYLSWDNEFPIVKAQSAEM